MVVKLYPSAVPILCSNRKVKIHLENLLGSRLADHTFHSLQEIEKCVVFISRVSRHGFPLRVRRRSLSVLIVYLYARKGFRAELGFSPHSMWEVSQMFNRFPAKASWRVLYPAPSFRLRVSSDWPESWMAFSRSVRSAYQSSPSRFQMVSSILILALIRRLTIPSV